MAARNDAGNTEKSQASMDAAARMLVKLGSALERIDVWVSEVPDDEHHITGINIRVRYDTVGDIMVVVKADTGDGKVVAFHSADTPSGCLLGLAHRLDNRTLKWREDVPYNGKST